MHCFMPILCLGLLRWELTCPVFLSAQPSVTIGAGPAMTPIYPEFTVSQLPADPPTGTVVIVTDAEQGSCSAGSGSSNTQCRWDGAAWVPVGDGPGTAPLELTLEGGGTYLTLLDTDDPLFDIFNVNGEEARMRWWTLDGDNGRWIFHQNGASDQFNIFFADDSDTAPPQLLRFFGNPNNNRVDVQLFDGNLDVRLGTVNVGDLSPVGADPLCWDGSGASLIGDCTSLRQYKTNIQDLKLGLSTVMAMQPRSFTWTAEMGGKEDIGFVAEEVEAVNPLLASYANYGVDSPTGEQLVGVKYEHYTAVLTKAIQEQQALIETLQAQVAALEALHSE